MWSRSTLAVIGTRGHMKPSVYIVLTLYRRDCVNRVIAQTPEETCCSGKQMVFDAVGEEQENVVKVNSPF